MATPGALANIPADSIIEQIYNGAVPAKLADSLGVHKCSIYRHLADHPEYSKAKKIGMHVRLDEAEQAVIESDERTLASARERFRIVAWRAEREHSDTWGQRGPSITINNNVLVLADSLAGDALELLDKLRTVSTQEEKP